MASTYLTRTISSNGNARTWTLSFWVKRSKLGSWTNTHNLGGTGNRDYAAFDSNDRLEVAHTNSGYQYRFITNRRFEDNNSWYHIVIRMDTTQATEANRTKIYVNGVQETSFSTASYPSQNHDTRGSQNKIMIGADFDPSNYFDGYISHFNFVDGTAYDATYFGSTDSTTGEWKINTSPNVTYGTNGCFILKDGNSVTDQSGNSNNFTVGGGTLTKSEDSPSNIFCTLNPLDKPAGASFNLTHGNTTLGEVGSDDNDMALRGTIGAKTGKYYWEVKSYNAGTLCVAKTNIRMVQSMTDSSPNSGVWGVQAAGNGTINSYNNGSFSNSNSFTDWSSGDIVMMALDLDNGKLFFGVNGTWKGLDNNTADPVNGTNPCFTSVSAGDDFITVFTEHRSAANPESSFNFGNGYFGTTAVSSAGTNASGIGIFEYNVPTGYTALSTKGLNE